MASQDSAQHGVEYFDISDWGVGGDGTSHGGASSSGGVGRIYCPVSGCAAANRVQSMKPHLEEHASGRLTGAIPQEGMAANAWGQCSVCSRIIHRRHAQACPKCRPSLHTAAVPVLGRVLQEGCPEIVSIFEKRVGVKVHVPNCAKQLWSQCLLAALASVIRHTDVRAWIELLALPKQVLTSHLRGEKGHKQKIEAETKKRCRDWLEGQRGSLWQPDPPNSKSTPKISPDDPRFATAGLQICYVEGSSTGHAVH
jgi:hypothetical protein